MTGQPLPPDVWADPAIRSAIEARDVGGLFRWLQRHGVAQRHIATLVGIGQSEVSECIKAHKPRQIVAYEVLVRVYLGLGIPRGWGGLAFAFTDLPLDVALVACGQQPPPTGDVPAAVARLAHGLGAPASLFSHRSDPAGSPDDDR